MSEEHLKTEAAMSAAIIRNRGTETTLPCANPEVTAVVNPKTLQVNDIVRFLWRKSVETPLVEVEGKIVKILPNHNYQVVLTERIPMGSFVFVPIHISEVLTS